MNTWPDGTHKSTGNAFNWRAKDHADHSIFAATSQERTPLFNEWLRRKAMLLAGESLADWPAYRAYHEVKEEENRIRRLKRHGKNP